MLFLSSGGFCIGTDFADRRNLHEIEIRFGTAAFSK